MYHNWGSNIHSRGLAVINAFLLTSLNAPSCTIMPISYSWPWLSVLVLVSQHSLGTFHVLVAVRFETITRGTNLNVQLTNQSPPETIKKEFHLCTWTGWPMTPSEHFQAPNLVLIGHRFIGVLRVIFKTMISTFGLIGLISL